MATGTHSHAPRTPEGWTEIVDVPFGADAPQGDWWRGNDTGRMGQGHPYLEYLKTTPIRGYPGDLRDYPERGEAFYDTWGMHTKGGKLVVPMVVLRDEFGDQPTRYISGEVRPEMNWSTGVMSDKLEGSYLMQICLRMTGGAGWGICSLIMPQEQDGIEWPLTGEYDWPETTSTIGWRTRGFHHSATSDRSDFTEISATASGRDWHLYEIEVVTGEYVSYWLDGHLVWRSEENVTECDVLYGNLQCGIADRDNLPTRDAAIEVDFWRVLKKD